MALGIQVFGLAFSALMLYMSFLYYKRKEFTFNEWGFWTGFAILFAIVALFPEILNPIVATLNLGRRLDLFVILGFMFLIAATFYTYRVVRNTDRRLSELVRKMAIEEKKKPK